MNPKQFSLWLLIISVAISALLGVIAILFGNFGWLEIRIILTMLAISGGSICGLSCGVLWERGNKKPLASMGITLSVLAVTLLIFGIWAEPNIERFWIATIEAWVFAVATSHICLLSLARLSNKFRPAYYAACVSIFTLALLIVFMLEIRQSYEFTLRLLGVNSIIVAALTILIPVFHRLSRETLVTEETKLHDKADEFFLTKCPKCGAEKLSNLGEIVCNECGCRFVLKILQA